MPAPSTSSPTTTGSWSPGRPGSSARTRSSRCSTRRRWPTSMVDPDSAREALARTVLIKLNGGLGTSMGMDRAKSLLPVRDGMTFLDVLVGQVRAARRGLRRAPSADPDEQLPDPGAEPGGPGGAPRHLGRRPAPGLPAEPGAQTPGGGPDPGRMASGSGARMVPSRSRGPLHRNPVLRCSRCAARPGLPVREHLQRRQPGRRPERDARGLVRCVGGARTLPSCAAAPPPTARAGTSRSASPTAG